MAYRCLLCSGIPQSGSAREQKPKVASFSDSHSLEITHQDGHLGALGSFGDEVEVS